MDEERKQKRFLYAGLLIIFLAVIFLYSASLFERRVTEIGQSSSIGNFFGEKMSETETEEVAKESTIDWKQIQFASCGDSSEFSTLPWWKNFAASVEQVQYHDEEELAQSVKRAVESESNVSEEILESYCALDQSDEERIRICAGERNKRLSIEDFKQYGEGCLSSDGTAFLAVFPGGYMGTGDHLFRYDIEADILEEAKRVIDEKEYGASGWNAPPISFGKRAGNVMKMVGGTGDAGCGVTTEFDYDYAANTVEMTRRCTSCDSARPVCKAF